MARPANPNVLSLRYATPAMNAIWSEKGKIERERNFWLIVMKAQKELGVDIPSEVIEAFERTTRDIDLSWIRRREIKTKHDLNAHLEQYVMAAERWSGESRKRRKVSGTKQKIHLGMTSRDVTDNVEQGQIRESAELIFGRYISVLRHLIKRAYEYDSLPLTARTHHQPAQVTALGRRFSMWAEELMIQLRSFEKFIENYPLRGIKGPVGTQKDMLRILGSPAKVDELEKRVANELGFKRILDSPGQVYPRSLDEQLVGHLSLLGSAVNNYALTMRLMAGYELVTEGFEKHQIGSSAMPYKMNTRNCERINTFGKLLKMYALGASLVSGDQWEEGDVSCSGLRRIVIPDAFYTSEGLCETSLHVLNGMGVYNHMLQKEVDRYHVFLATTQILSLAVNAGIGRQDAHEIIRTHAVQQARAIRNGISYVPLTDALSNHPVFKKAGISKGDLEKAIEISPRDSMPGAERQTRKIRAKAGRLLKKYWADAAYEPKEIL